MSAERIYVDDGLTGANRDRPRLKQALAVCCAGDRLVVTKLDRLARLLPDARAIADELTQPSVKLNLGGSVLDPTDPVGWLLCNVLVALYRAGEHTVGELEKLFPGDPLGDLPRDGARRRTQRAGSPTGGAAV